MERERRVSFVPVCLYRLNANDGSKSSAPDIPQLRMSMERILHNEEVNLRPGTMAPGISDKNLPERLILFRC